MILISFKFFVQARFTMLAKSDTTFSNLGVFEIFDMSNFKKDVITLLINLSSSSLFLIMVLFLVVIYSSVMEIITAKGVWLDVSYQSKRIEYMFNLEELHYRNIKLMTEFELLLLLEYLVETWLIE